MSAPVAAATPVDLSADELLHITLAALNARPRFWLGHVGTDRAAQIRDSYALAYAIEQYFARARAGEDA